MKCLKRTVAFSLILRPSSGFLKKKACVPILLLLWGSQIAHADVSSETATAVIDISVLDSAIALGPGLKKLALSSTDKQREKSWLSFGGSLGFGATYLLLGVKGYLGTPYVRVFTLIGLGVGAGVDIKLGNRFELGLTRAIMLGGGGWDVVALRYHPKGAFERGWFFGIEYIGNRTSARNDESLGTERKWFGTIGFDF